MKKTTWIFLFRCYSCLNLTGIQLRMKQLQFVFKPLIIRYWPVIFFPKQIKHH